MGSVYAITLSILQGANIYIYPYCDSVYMTVTYIQSPHFISSHFQLGGLVQMLILTLSSL